MTLEQLVSVPAAELEAMSQEELENYCRPFWPVCRPELVSKTEVKKPKGPTQESLQLERDKKAAVALAATFGFKIKL